MSNPSKISGRQGVRRAVLTEAAILPLVQTLDLKDAVHKVAQVLVQSRTTRMIAHLDAVSLVSDEPGFLKHLDVRRRRGPGNHAKSRIGVDGISATRPRPTGMGAECRVPDRRGVKNRPGPDISRARWKSGRVDFA
jgi:hypothetical protein